MAGGLNRNITVRLLADTSKFTAGMAKVSAEAEKTSTTMEASGGKTKLLTTGIAAAGIAATALGVAAVRMAADFDASMSTVQANTGASADEMSLLRQAAIDAGADTVYSATDAADAINELGKAGMSTSDILSGGLNGALDLAASDGMEVAEAAELMSSAMAQFNLTGADATRIADALAAGAGKAQGSARDLGYALQQSGMVANSFGIGMEETVGTLTSFANAGMTGSDAGTSLKSMLIALANPTKKAQNLMDELGISAYDAQGNFIGLKALAGQLQTQMSGLTQAQRNQALATIFGSDAIRAANVLYNEGSDGIADWTKKVSDSGYAAQQAAADRMSSAVGVSATADGYTITVDGVLGDAFNCLVHYTLSTQDGTPLSVPGWVPAEEGSEEEVYLGYYFQDANGGLELYDEDPNDGTVQFVERIDLYEEHPQETITRTFQNLYFGNYWEDESNVIAQGPWELTFPLTYENTSLTLDAGQMLQLKEHGIVLDEVTLSPLSVTAKSSFDTVVDWEEDVQSDPFADYEDMPDGMAAMNIPITVTLKDGTTAETVGNRSSIGDRDGKTVCSNNVRFREIIPLEDIASITVGTVTIPLG